jgi:transposase
MDNAPIHTSSEIQNLIESRGYKCVYLPPYSPFLNTIEEFWSKVKAGIERECLSATDNLSQRIVASAKKITEKYCRGWISHSVLFFDRCLAAEQYL